MRKPVVGSVVVVNCKGGQRPAIVTAVAEADSGVIDVLIFTYNMMESAAPVTRVPDVRENNNPSVERPIDTWQWPDDEQTPDGYEDT